MISRADLERIADALHDARNAYGYIAERVGITPGQAEQVIAAYVDNFAEQLPNMMAVGRFYDPHRLLYRAGMPRPYDPPEGVIPDEVDQELADLYVGGVDIKDMADESRQPWLVRGLSSAEISRRLNAAGVRLRNQSRPA